MTYLKRNIAKKLRPNWQYFDLESAVTFDKISNDLTFFFKENTTHLIIDEAQIYPDIFKELRGVIDADRTTNNRFIITGSSSLELLKTASESLAGRVGIVELSTFKINEVIEKPLSKFYDIFDKKLSYETLENIKNLKVISTHKQSKKHFLRGGYPDAALSMNDFAYTAWMKNYTTTYINRDVRTLFPKLDLIKFRRFTQILANISGQISNLISLGT